MNCTATPDKIQFGSLRGAAEHMIHVYEEHGVWQRPYCCDDCFCWHLTSHDLDGNPVSDRQASQLLDAVGL